MTAAWCLAWNRNAIQVAVPRFVATDAERAEKALIGTVGKRVTYQDTNRAAGYDAGPDVSGARAG